MSLRDQIAQLTPFLQHGPECACQPYSRTARRFPYGPSMTPEERSSIECTCGLTQLLADVVALLDYAIPALRDQPDQPDRLKTTALRIQAAADLAQHLCDPAIPFPEWRDGVGTLILRVKELARSEMLDALREHAELNAYVSGVEDQRDYEKRRAETAEAKLDRAIPAPAPQWQPMGRQFFPMSARPACQHCGQPLGVFLDVSATGFGCSEGHQHLPECAALRCAHGQLWEDECATCERVDE